MQAPDPKREKLTIIVAQVFISAMMALLMTFIFDAWPHGFAAGWFTRWISHYAVAWPVAFLLSLGVGPLAFKLAFMVMHRRENA